MKRLLTLLLYALSLAAATPALAALNVFACEPEWGALASEIGGSRVSVFNATTGLQDPHKIQARPSLIARARSADLAICSGAELEVGWMPVILQQSGNPRIQPSQPGYLDAASIVPLLEVPAALDRSMGDVHPMGNPHIQGDPRNMRLVADELAKRLARLDPAGAAEYQSRLQAFSKRWEEAIQKWEREAASLKGVAVIEHHKELSYLFHWLHMPVVGSLEPKPGVEPTSSHLQSLMEQQKTTPARMIVRTTDKNPEASRWLSERTKIPAVDLPASVGGTPAAKDLFSFYDDMIARLLAAAKS